VFRGGSGVQRTGRPAIRIRELSGEIEINEQQVVDLITAEALTKPLAGRYDAIEPLATLRPGAFSIVVTARDLRSQKRVVLKFLNTDEPYRVACFERECVVSELLVGKRNVIQLAGGRDHVKVSLIEPKSGLPFEIRFHFFALELGRETLTGFLLRHRRPPPVYRRLEIIRDVVKGVGRLHRAGYCHRDLKPDNVLRFSGGVAKVADFGTCRLHSGADPIADPLQYMWPAGDMMYAAPEMYSGAGLDPALYVGADWFGVGAILFEAVTGQNLYVAMNLRSPNEIKRALAAAVDTAGYLRRVGNAVGNYPIPSTSDFSESWLRPLRAETHNTLTSLIQDLCHLDYRRRLTDFDRVLHRVDMAIIRTRRDRLRG
jgi:serine/threonine protein kinase